MILKATYKGAEVFPNVNCTGKTDLIIKYNDIVFEVDVKLARPHYKNGYWYCSSNIVKAPVYPVKVVPEGDVLSWKADWVGTRKGPNAPPNCPEGLEDFWS